MMQFEVWKSWRQSTSKLEWVYFTCHCFGAIRSVEVMAASPSKLECLFYLSLLWFCMQVT